MSKPLIPIYLQKINFSIHCKGVQTRDLQNLKATYCESYKTITPGTITIVFAAYVFSQR